MKKFLFLCILFLVTPSLYGEPKRELGLSVHMLPKQVAELDSSLKWGFVVSKNEGGKIVFQSSVELINYFSTLSTETKENGIWIVTTHPDAYSDSEKESVEKLKRLCKEKKINLFFCRGSKLPDGWVKADLFLLKDDN